MSSSTDDPSLSEWQNAREVLDKYDEKLHDLRKYGFSFITALLSVDALFAVGASSWKLAALVGTLFLIVPLDFVDRNYRIFQEAASLRAQIIERRTRMNLTQTITRLYLGGHVKFVFESVYIIFILATLLLGWIIFGTASSFHYWSLVIFSVAAIGAVWLFLWQREPLPQYIAGVVVVIIALVLILEARWIIHPGYLQSELTIISLLLRGEIPRFEEEAVHYHLSSLSLHYHLILLVMVTVATALILIIEKGVKINEWVDFEIDGFDYVCGDHVLAMITNLGSKDVVLSDPLKGVVAPSLTVHREDDRGTSISCAGLGVELANAVTLQKAKVGWSDYRWLFSTKGLTPGLYRAVYNGPTYFRTGMFRRTFNLLDPRNESDRNNLKEKFGYDQWFNCAQRFRVHLKKNEK